mmetsp:Transcript_41330/g.66494  ORF Transcript_41330/g.66494 Transcript_41330/m.66494 type:complete len:289 (+) Transcript_41330:456-1322(+)
MKTKKNNVVRSSSSPSSRAPPSRRRRQQQQQQHPSKSDEKGAGRNRLITNLNRPQNKRLRQLLTEQVSDAEKAEEEEEEEIKKAARKKRKLGQKKRRKTNRSRKKVARYADEGVSDEDIAGGQQISKKIDVVNDRRDHTSDDDDISLDFDVDDSHNDNSLLYHHKDVKHVAANSLSTTAKPAKGNTDDANNDINDSEDDDGDDDDDLSLESIEIPIVRRKGNTIKVTESEVMREERNGDIDDESSQQQGEELAIINRKEKPKEGEKKKVSLNSLLVGIDEMLDSSQLS